MTHNKMWLAGLAPVLAAVLLADMSRRVMGLPGRPGSPPPGGKSELYTVDDLRQELGETVPESVYHVFGTAVMYHLAGDFDSARKCYDSLCHLKRAHGGVYDLSKDSKVLRHNMSMLSKAKK